MKCSAGLRTWGLVKRKHNDYKVKIRKDSSTLIIHALYTLEHFLSSQILRRKILKIFTFFLQFHVHLGQRMGLQFFEDLSLHIVVVTSRRKGEALLMTLVGPIMSMCLRVPEGLQPVERSLVRRDRQGTGPRSWKVMEFWTQLRCSCRICPYPGIQESIAA